MSVKVCGFRIIPSVSFIFIIIFSTVSVWANSGKPLYLDPACPIDKRVDDLLGRMTLAEKIGQLNMPCAYKKISILGEDIPTKLEGCRKFTLGERIDEIGPGGGFFVLVNTLLQKGPRQQAEFINELQKIAREKTRLKIPLFIMEEGTHGLMCAGGTIFPEGLGLGSTWNMDLIEEVYSIAAREARAIGAHQLYTLVIEPNRDPRMGRNQEGYSEDPFLCSRIAEAIVAGAQGDDVSAADKVVAGLCHYPGQSQPVSGMERGAMEISERCLREVFLPPWVAGIKKAGALGVMATYPAIDGIPAHGSQYILTKILREELGFEGLVLGEGAGLTTLMDERVVATSKESGALIIKAGVDVGISLEDEYMRSMVENVQEGIVSVKIIDRAVGRILRMKFLQGLFENPYVDPDRAVKVSNTNEHQKTALQAAREGIVLLKNEKNLLPLNKNIKSIALIGPNVDNERNQLGDYVSDVIPQEIVTVLDGISAKVSPNTKITYVKGCNVLKTDLNEIPKAQAAARNADVAIVVVGENERFAPGRVGTNGEHKDVASLDLTGLQQELVKAVYDTGTPTIVVLINGRPLSTRWIAEHVPVILEAWLPGERGGHAVADILFGDYNPSGRLAITVPRHVGQLPVYYNMKPLKALWRKRRGYVDMSALPLFEFGYGLSYTKFEYSNLRITPQKTRPGSMVHISVDVKNTGSRMGQEVVQLYINDVISSVSTPVIELKGFKKITLEPREKKTVRFTLYPDHLAFLDQHLEWVVEPGEFEVMVGHSCEDIRLRGVFVCN